jgi:hypothetical protein
MMPTMERVRRAISPVHDDIEGSEREQHAIETALIAIDLAAKARFDDSSAAKARWHAIAPEIATALRWALTADHPTAPTLAASLGILAQQYGSDARSVSALVLAGHNAYVRETATAQELLALGAAIAAVDVVLVDQLATTALGRAVNSRDRLLAFHLAGVADTYNNRGRDALAMLDVAEQLALEFCDEWEAAAISQTQAIALTRGETRNRRDALTAFETAARRYESAGDRMHVRSCRYMMAITATGDGTESDLNE